MNVIWIFGDQHRAQALSDSGDPNLNTPNIDRLGREGIRYERAVSGTPLCCPYRGSLLTSRYPHECVPGHEHPLPEGQSTVAHVFDEYQYDTAYFGKWHLDGFHESEGRAAFHTVPPGRRGGFKRWIGYENNNRQWDCWVHGHEPNGGEIERYRLPGYETDCLTDLLIEYLGEKGRANYQGQKDPFFAVLSVQPPHNPYVAPAEFMGRHNPAQIQLRPNVPDVARVQERSRRELAGMYAMIENLDWNIGRIMEALKQHDLDRETYVIFFSDHGDMHGSHGQFLKTSPWEESMRVPFMINNGKQTGSIQKNTLINHVDIAPTSLGLAGIDPPGWMRGHDYSCHWDESRPQVADPDSAFIQIVVPTRHPDSIDRPWRAIVTDDGWKYVVLEGQPWLMFNLNEDPYEQVNLAHNTLVANERKRLQARLKRWIDETGDTFLLPEI